VFSFILFICFLITLNLILDPGNDFVDWVALSLYYSPLTPDNPAVPPTYLVDYLTGSGPVLQNVADFPNDPTCN
jgi:hypothetical protein